MKRGYGQYCPLALAAELLCERWTVLIISRFLDGCRQFNEMQRGLPRITPVMLAKRLRELTAAGLVVSAPAARGSPREYRLTEAGEALAPLIENLAIWGQNWARDMCDDDLDPSFLAWSMHLRMEAQRLPHGRTVLGFEFTGTPRDRWRFWLVSLDGKIEMCLDDPGFDVDVYVRADLRLFIEAWRGIRDLRGEIRAGRIRVMGPPALTKQFPEWLRLSMLAPYERKKDGAERRRSRRTRSASNARPVNRSTEFVRSALGEA